MRGMIGCAVALALAAARPSGAGPAVRVQGEADGAQLAVPLVRGCAVVLLRPREAK